jgi:hypothetical protein
VAIKLSEMGRRAYDIYEEMRNGYNIVVGKLQRKLPPRRPAIKQEVIARRMNMKGRGCEDGD